MEQNGSTNGCVVTENYKKFPYEVVKFDDAIEKRVLLHFNGPVVGLLQIGPEKWIMPTSYAEHAENLYNFKARSDDVYISTYPRSGTTWTQEMMWLLCNDLNYEAAKETKLDWRFPFFEISSFLPSVVDDMLNAMKDIMPPPAPEALDKMTSQRLIKTHLPIKLLPHDALDKGCKIVYVARNPKDVLVSLYYFTKNPGYLFNGNFEQLLEYFMDDLMTWGPYFEHIKDGWSHRNDKNVLFLFYEDLVVDLKGSLKKLATFLDRPLNDRDLPELIDHLNIQNFKQNSSVNMDHVQKLIPNNKWDFVRSGKIGGNVEMTPEIAEKIDEWTERQLLGSDLKFPHQLKHKLEMYKLKANSQFRK